MKPNSVTKSTIKAFGLPHGASSAERLKVAVFLQILGQAYTGRRDIAEAGRIVSYLVRSEGMKIPPWRNLPEICKFDLIALTGDHFGVSHALTFDISDQQRADWQRKHGNVCEGFKREVLYKTRHIFPEVMTYWLAVEPHVSKGKAARQYQDVPNFQRRFDVHMAIALPETVDPKQSARIRRRFDKAIWKRTHKLVHLKLVSSPDLSLRGRMAYRRPIHFSDGWQDYCFKYASRTITQHADVTGLKPWGASQNLRRATQQLYTAIRAEALSAKLDPACLAKVEAASDAGANMLTACTLLHDAFHGMRAPWPPLSPFR